MKIKKISLLLLVFSLTGTLFANELNSFKKGFTIGLEAVDYQLKHEGYEPKTIKLESPYIVMLDIKSTPTNNILYFQHLLAKDGIESLVTKNFLLVDSFDRKPDAYLLKKTLESKYKIDLKVEELTDGVIETYPILFTRTFDKVISSVTKDANVTYVKKYKTPLQIRLEKKNHKKIAYEYFKLKNTAMTYKYKYNKNDGRNCINPKSRCYESKRFYENRIFDINSKFKKGGIYTTSEGETFQKVYNKNLFVDINDIVR